MKLVGAGNNGVITLIPKAVSDGRLRRSVSASCHGFEAHHPEVWTELARVDEFVNAVTGVIEKRKGSANWPGPGRDEFSMEIRLLDPLGHVMVSVKTRRPTRVFGESLYQEASISFELDSGSTGGLRERIMEFGNECLAVSAT